MSILRLVVEFRSGAEKAEVRQFFSNRFGLELAPVFPRASEGDGAAGLAAFLEAPIDLDRASALLAFLDGTAGAVPGVKCVQVQDCPKVEGDEAGKIRLCPEFEEAVSKEQVVERSAVLAQVDSESLPEYAELQPGDFRHRQEYLDRSRGVGAADVWEAGIAGSRGEHVTLADVELGWKWHPELGIDASGDLQGARGAHGSAVLGVLFAAHDHRGVTGLVPEASPLCVRVACMGQNSVAAAVHDLTLNLPRGSVILLETQYALLLQRKDGSCCTPPLAMETACDARKAIACAVDAGLHVVQAAGNGGIDLDNFLPTGADSGSIVVGAGSPVEGRRGRSNCGARVNLFSWSSWVTTTGAWVNDDSWRDLSPGRTASDYTDECYTKSFSGTSAAAAIVAGAAGIIAGIFAAHGLQIPPRRLRQLLVDSGYHKSESQGQRIGVHPDLVAACCRAAGDLLPEAVRRAVEKVASCSR